MQYLLESSILLILFYACYRLFLEKETFFGSIRWFLLLGLLTSFALPLLVIPNYIEVQAPTQTANLQFAVVESFDSGTSVETPTDTPVDWMQIFWCSYLIGILFFTLRLTIQLL